MDDYFWINVLDHFDARDRAVYVLYLGADQTKINEANNLVFLGLNGKIPGIWSSGFLFFRLKS